MSSPRKPRRRKPPSVTQEALRKAALHYLERFAASSGQLRAVLMRRVHRASLLPESADSDRASAARQIDTIITDFLRAGLLDDGAFASAQAETLHRRGLSRRLIRQKLAAKGINGEMTELALGSANGGAGADDLAAAGALARRRRLGPYRLGAARAEFSRKDLAALARAGFALDIARRIVNASSIEELEHLIATGEA